MSSMYEVLREQLKRQLGAERATREIVSRFPNQAKFISTFMLAEKVGLIDAADGFLAGIYLASKYPDKLPGMWEFIEALHAGHDHEGDTECLYRQAIDTLMPILEADLGQGN